MRDSRCFEGRVGTGKCQAYRVPLLGHERRCQIEVAIYDYSAREPDYRRPMERLGTSLDRLRVLKPKKTTKGRPERALLQSHGEVTMVDSYTVQRGEVVRSKVRLRCSCGHRWDVYRDVWMRPSRPSRCSLCSARAVDAKRQKTALALRESDRTAYTGHDDSVRAALRSVGWGYSGDVAECLGVLPQTASAVLARLERAGELESEYRATGYGSAPRKYYKLKEAANG